MSPGQRKYIEQRRKVLNDRAVWLRSAVKQDWAQDWHRQELADLEGRIAYLNQQLVNA